MTVDLKGRIALVTGASRGIGNFTALELAKAGAHVIACARTVGGLEDLDDAISAAGGSATLVPFDLNDMNAIDALGGSIFERWASSTFSWPMPACSARFRRRACRAKVFEKVMTINVTATWRLIRSIESDYQVRPRPRIDPVFRRRPQMQAVLGALLRSKGRC